MCISFLVSYRRCNHSFCVSVYTCALHRSLYLLKMCSGWVSFTFSPNDNNIVWCWSGKERIFGFDVGENPDERYSVKRGNFLRVFVWHWNFFLFVTFFLIDESERLINKFNINQFDTNFGFDILPVCLFSSKVSYIIQIRQLLWYVE